MSELTDHAARNRDTWNAQSDEYQAKHGAQLDASGGDAWGMWQIPESELNVLGDVAGLDVLELGCGAAQWAIALAKRGARMTGLDLSERQLEHARAAIEAAGVDVTLVEASAEAIPLPDASFDVVFCDHGALSFADPYLTIPEAARVLRPGGLLAFSMVTPFAEVHWPIEDNDPGTELVFDYHGMHVLHADEEIVFQLPYSGWIRVLLDNGLVIEDLIDLRPAADATSSYRSAASLDWARRWPIEHIWKARRAPAAGA